MRDRIEQTYYTGLYHASIAAWRTIDGHWKTPGLVLTLSLRRFVPWKTSGYTNIRLQTRARLGLDTLDGHGSLAVELAGVALVALLLTVLKTLALVVFQQAMLAAKVAIAEAAVADDALRRILALFEIAADLLGWHSTAKRQGHVQRRVWLDVVGRERG